MISEIDNCIEDSEICVEEMRECSSLVKAFAAGSVSGTCSAVLFQPLDLVKTRLIAHGLGSRGSTSMLYTFYSVVEREHLVGLWRGLVPSISRCVPGVGMYFCCIHWLKGFLREEPTILQSIILGASARTAVGVCLLPVTVVKARYESGVFRYKSMSDAFASIWRTEGGKGLYSGLLATVARDAPFSGLYLMFYTQIKKNMKSFLETPQLSPGQTFISGVTAGMLACVVTQPADVVKTRLQLFPQNHSGNTDAVACIVKNDGVQGLFRGLLPRTLRKTLMAAMAWTVYEELSRRMGLT